MKTAIIVAVSENGVIGHKNDIPWHLPNDMKFFKETTNGCVVITGRKNYESIPEKYRPLPNRTNIVLTTQKDYLAPGAIVVNSIDEAFTTAHMHTSDEGKCFIIGGGEIYREALKHEIDEIYITKVHMNIEGDVTFSELNIDHWQLVEEKHHPIDVKHKYAFTFLKYIPK